MVQRYIFCFFTQTQKYVKPVLEAFLGVTTQKVLFFCGHVGLEKGLCKLKSCNIVLITNEEN